VVVCTWLVVIFKTRFCDFALCFILRMGSCLEAGCRTDVAASCGVAHTSPAQSG
jgi:hypothetical protein